LISFAPTHLEQLRDEILQRFPDPATYAQKEDAFAQDLISEIRDNRSSFQDLGIFEIRHCYQLAQLCNEEEFVKLRAVVSQRMNQECYEIGWHYCQLNPDHQKAVMLFADACKWMEKNRPEVFRSSLMSKTGLIWNSVYELAAEILRVEKLSKTDFCEKYGVDAETPFFERIQLAYFSRCEKAELLEQEELLVRLIYYGSLEQLRPMVKNYTSKFDFEEISERIRDAITYRIAIESSGETLGLAPTMLRRLRNIRFCSVLGECVELDSQKNNVYNAVAGMARNIELLTHGYFVIDFGKYMVLDNRDWKDEAYAYAPELFHSLSEEWKQAGYPENYWPAVSEMQISEAREIVLGMKQTDVVRLKFSGFELLYSRDLLSITRY